MIKLLEFILLFCSIFQISFTLKLICGIIFIIGGQFKRTLTPYKRSTSSDRAKVQEDINIVHQNFKSFLKEVRPTLNVDKVATGEVWLGTEALKKGLCDKIATSDEVLLLMHNNNKEIFTVTHRKRAEDKPSILQLFEDENQQSSMSIFFNKCIEMIAISVMNKLSVNTNNNEIFQGSNHNHNEIMAIDSSNISKTLFKMK